jgi:uncharacterized protein YjiS (DUF1127 family)
MAALWDWPVARQSGTSKRRNKAERRFSVYAPIVQTLRLWRERHRRRWELAMLSDDALKDTGVPRDLIAHEARKWPWQAWHPQLRAFEEAARRQTLAQP